jgi:hypothetical protein
MDRIELGSDLEIELDVFSGRRNPRWALSGERAVDIRERLRDLEPAERRDPPGLGYRGFLVHDRRLTLRVFDSLVTILVEGRSWRDTGGVEELLITQAREHGYDDVLRAFRDKPRPSRTG